MSKKSLKIAALIEACRGQELDPHYLGFFECFNRGMFYEAHDVLEELWLRNRTSPNYGFYKGLIQLAGAFVHLQKNRLRPAASLFNLAEANLKKYPSRHEHLDVSDVLALVREWREKLQASDFTQSPLTATTVPILSLSNSGFET